MPNRVVLTTSAKAGDKFEIAIFGIQRTDLGRPAEFHLVPRGACRVLQVTLALAGYMDQVRGYARKPARSNAR
jgi:hypothetical protein